MTTVFGSVFLPRPLSFLGRHRRSGGPTSCQLTPVYLREGNAKIALVHKQDHVTDVKKIDDREICPHAVPGTRSSTSSKSSSCVSAEVRISSLLKTGWPCRTSGSHTALSAKHETTCRFSDALSIRWVAVPLPVCRTNRQFRRSANDARSTHGPTARLDNGLQQLDVDFIAHLRRDIERVPDKKLPAVRLRTLHRAGQSEVVLLLARRIQERIVRFGYWPSIARSA